MKHRYVKKKTATPLFAERDWHYQHKEFHKLFFKYHTEQESDEPKVAVVTPFYHKSIPNPYSEFTVD